MTTAHLGSSAAAQLPDVRLVDVHSGDVRTWPGVVHPVADLFPLLQPSELEEMADTIRTDGLNHPVVVSADGQLLDGRNRLRACALAGLDPVPAQTYTGDSPLQFVIRENLRRRHLDTGQRAMLAVQLLPFFEAEAKQRMLAGTRQDPRTDPTEGRGEPQWSAHQAARATGTSGTSVKLAKRLTTEAPDLAEKVRVGDVALDRAARMLRDHDAEQARRAEALANPRPPELRIDLRVGDFRCVLTDVGPVDAIITDPPYPAEYLPLLAGLAKAADEVLTPDGVLAVLIGQTHLPEVYRLLEGGRPYRWTACYLTPGAGSASHARRCQSNWKPVLVYGGGPRFADVVRSDADTGKAHHHWGQDYGGFAELVQRLTQPGHVVLDPFMGAGTTLVAAHHLGRHVIGCDIDSTHVATAAGRLGVNPP